MKKTLVALVFALATLVFCAPVSAQETLTFDTKEACLAVLPFSGGEDSQFYKPVEFRGHGKMPVNGITQVLLALPRNGCVHMKVMGGAMKWVPQRGDTALRAHPKNGMLVIYARHDCGNPADAVAYPEPKILKGEPGSQGMPGLRGPRGYRGEPGKDVVLPISTPSPLKWGFTGGVSRGSYSGPIADRELCKIDNWTANLGLAYGDPNRFFGRLTFMAVLIDDGSSSNYICANCGTVTAVSNGMKVLGGNLEGVILFGPRNWKIQPTLYLEGGGGVVQGQVDRYVTHSGSTTVQRADAEEFFGYKGLAHGGGGAGLTWHTSPAVSLELAGKYTYPYGMSVGLSLTKWLGKK